jgi:hypothetical protein
VLGLAVLIFGRFQVPGQVVLECRHVAVASGAEPLLGRAPVEIWSLAPLSPLSPR